MSDDLNLSGPQKFLKSIGTTLEEVGAWLKGMGLSLFGGSEPVATTEPQSVAEDKGKKAKEEENEQEQGEAEEQTKAEERIAAEKKAKAEEEALAQEKVQAEEKARAAFEQLKNQAEVDLAALQKVVEAIVEEKLRQPVSEGVAKLKSGLGAALKIEALSEQNSALGLLVQEIATVRSDADVAAKESEKLVLIRQRVAQVQSQVESALSEVDKTVMSIGEAALQDPQAQQLEALKKRLSTSQSQTDPAVQEQEFGTLLVAIGKLKEDAGAAKVQSDEIMATRERVAQLKKQVEAELGALQKVVDGIAEASLQQSSTEALAKLHTGLEAGLKLAKLEEQETALGSLGGEIKTARSAADKAAIESAAIVATRERIAALRSKVEKELAQVEKLASSTGDQTYEDKAWDLAERMTTTDGLTDLDSQEKGYGDLARDVQTLKSGCEAFLKLKADFEKNYGAMNADVEKARAAVDGKPGVPAKEGMAFGQADRIVNQAADGMHYQNASDGLGELKKATDAVLKILADGDKFYAGIAKFDGVYKAALDELNSGDPAPNDDVLDEVRTAVEEMEKAVEAKDWPRAEGSLKAVKDAADKAADARVAKDSFDKTFGPMEAQRDAVHKLAGGPTVAEDVGLSYRILDGEIEIDLYTRDWGEAEKKLKALKTAMDAVELSKSEHDAFFVEYDKVDAKKASDIANGGNLPTATMETFFVANQAVNDLFAERKWVLATGKVKALAEAISEMDKVLAAGESYYKAYEGGAGIHDAALKIAKESSNALPPAVKSRFDDARAALKVQLDIPDWVEASKLLKELKEAGAEVLDEKAEYDAFYQLYWSFTDAFNAAEKAAAADMAPDAAVKSFNAANLAVNNAFGARQWRDAKKEANELKKESLAMAQIIQQGQAYYSEFDTVIAKYNEACGLISSAPYALPAETQKKFEELKTTMKSHVESGEWEEARKLVAGIGVAAEDVVRSKAEFDAFLVDYRAIADSFKTALDAVKGGMVPATESDAFKVANSGVNNAVDERKWVDAKNKVVDLKRECLAIEQILSDGDRYYQAYAAIATVYNGASNIMANHKDVLTKEIIAEFEKAQNSLKVQVDGKAWDLAVQALESAKKAAIKINKAGEDCGTFWATFGPIQARYNKAYTAAEKAGLADPEGKNMIEANVAMMKGYDAKDWLLAESKCAALLIAVGAVETVLQNPTAAAYYTEFGKIEAEYDKAMDAIGLRLDKLDLLTSKVLAARKVAQDAAKKKDFTAATNALPALKKAVEDLAAAGATYKGAKDTFDKEFKKIANLPAAQKIAAKPPKKLAAVEAKGFLDLYVPFNDAKNKGEFETATNAISGVQAAINTLVDAEARYTSGKVAYEEELKKVTKLAAAQAIVESGSAKPAIVAKVVPFNLARKAVDDAVTAEDWGLAKSKVSSLKDRVDEVLEAETQADASVTSEDDLKIKKKVSDLKARTDLATKGTQPKFVETLKKAVRSGVKEVNKLIGEKKYAKAEVSLARLVVDLAAMEKAEVDFEKYHKKYDAAFKGEVDKARQLTLEPPKLGETRTKALQETQDRITRLAGNGKFTKATQMVAEWEKEAKAWQASKEAYDNLNSDTDEPDAAKLQALNGQPGGSKVLDKLMAELPDGKPEKFLKSAINARFGIDVKRFDKRDPNDTHAIPTTELDKNLPDKSLKKMYELMAKLPAHNVKGPVANLVVFDESGGGASFSYGTKTVKMYCGRANDPNGSKQSFNKPGSIMPPGEEVEEDFQAVDDKEVPYFDFATLHEVGHAVESQATALMSQAGWQTPTSDEVAAKAAAHFKYDLDYVKATLADKKSVPPTTTPSVPSSSNPGDWEKARIAVVDWCQSVRVSNALWEKPGVSKMLSIGGRVFQEAYEDYWVSYDFSARSKGISSYQFRASGEWFAELYAAYFSGKLKKTHPYAPDLKKLKKP